MPWEKKGSAGLNKTKLDIFPKKIICAITVMLSFENMIQNTLEKKGAFFLRPKKNRSWQNYQKYLLELSQNETRGHREDFKTGEYNNRGRRRGRVWRERGWRKTPWGCGNGKFNPRSTDIVCAWYLYVKNTCVFVLQNNKHFF